MGPFNVSQRNKGLVIALLLASVVIPAEALRAADSTDYAQPGGDPQRFPDILVTGDALIRDIVPEYELDEDGIASFGAGTVDELLAEITGHLGEDEMPMILVNGERVTDLSDISGYPVEVLRNVRVLPRGAAVRVGGMTGQRVVSLTLQRRMRAATLTVAPRTATEGDWHSTRGESLFTYIQGVTRANVALRFRGESNLLEEDRDIIQPVPFRPFAAGGNVIPHPSGQDEIDPALSAAAGVPVTVAPVPGTAQPTLADFAAQANQQNETDLGAFRTLRPRFRNYDLNGTFNTRLTPWLTSNAGLRFTRNSTIALRGLPTGWFLLDSDNAASPFTRDVGIVYYGAQPLESRVLRNNAEARIGLNGRFGLWSSNFNARHYESRDRVRTERQATSALIPLDDSINPFASDMTNLIALRTDTSRSRTIADLAQLSFTGPAFNLPAGPVRTTVEGRLAWNRTRSQSSFAIPVERRFDRNEQSIRAAVDLPLTSRANNILADIGDLTGTAEIGRMHYSDAGWLDRYGLGLIWDPVQAFQFRTSIERIERPAAMQILGGPVIETPDVRVFDPVRGETVDVLQITGGNIGIRPESMRTWRIGGEVRPLQQHNLVLSAEYTDTDARNFISMLPPTSVPVMLAFPDRYIRDANGVLTTIDLRPVNFDSLREKRLRWGARTRTRLTEGALGASPLTAAGDTDGEEPITQPDRPAPARAGVRPATYMELTLNHNVVFSEEMVIRPGLDRVDLLGGGALGIGGGRVRHQLDGTAAVTSGGLGARLTGTWRGPSRLDTQIGGISDTIHFDSLFIANLRLFADARRILPNVDLARGTRVSLNVLNLTNERQQVRDSAGNTPLQYQPGYRDPLGRTVEIEFRRVF